MCAITSPSGAHLVAGPRRRVQVLVALVLAVLLSLVAGTARADPRAVPGPGEVEQDVRTAASVTDTFWRRAFEAGDLTYRPVSRVYGYVPGDGTGCGPYANVPNNARYCRPDNDIAFDDAWLARSYAELGDAFVYYVISHEYAHAVQDQLGVRHGYAITQELQADCLSGASLGWAVRAGELVLEDGDVDELLAGLRSVGDADGVPWFDPAAHGTADQRTASFGKGFDKGAEACL